MGILLKLSAPANEVEIKRTHERLLAELAETSVQQNDKTGSSFVTAVVRGLRFVLEQIEVHISSSTSIQVISTLYSVCVLVSVRWPENVPCWSDSYLCKLELVLSFLWTIPVGIPVLMFFVFSFLTFHEVNFCSL